MVYGPIAHAVDNLDKLNTSAAEIWHLIDGSSKTVPPTGFYAFADVRDRKLKKFLFQLLLPTYITNSQ